MTKKPDRIIYPFGARRWLAVPAGIHYQRFFGCISIRQSLGHANRE